VTLCHFQFHNQKSARNLKKSAQTHKNPVKKS